MKMDYQFPAGFWWGSAASGPQTEGVFEGDGKGASIWDYWYQQEPEKFFNGVGPEKTSQVYTRYQEDIQLMKETGHTTFRTSIQWSRLFPQGKGEVNQKAVDFYNAYIDELIANGIEPFMNLYHFDMPMALQEKGGWLNRETVDAYVAFAQTCFTLFGDRVKKWFTHNEPIVPVEGGYLYQFHYPNEINMKHAVQVGFHETLASAKAIKVYHEMNLGGEIGIILNLTPSYPRDENDPEDVKAAQIADAFFNRSFLDPAVKGTFPEELVTIVKELDMVPAMEADDLQTIRENTIDLLGINYYQPRRIMKKESPIDQAKSPMPDDYFDNYDMPNKKMNPYRGWEIYEKGIYDILTNTRENYGNIKCYISENGMGVEGEERFVNADGVIEDDYRIEFVSDHLKYVHQAIQEGTNCVGYHMWTCMDNWSWTNAYKNRYGFISVDLANDAKRTVKKSGRWFKEVSDNNGF
ncbi:glycoside hydrolase family 1 protein [Enterococcus sp. PF-2]|jgi:6-phospho-beta-glucosidase|uniref:glycoside hydrolase family 1 protein n=2 Tax=Enterococcus TaxID=1350 RepID=UPI00076B35F6|nr:MULTISPECIES: glycoside hydrolase family 1 protein [Enterococcus]AMG49310.1 glycoside hydrolase family 1 protein [Enterococcus gallinarum]AUJ84047.1 glycoside hydrolase family 1 protein [Enterococcus sp. CR-Ec1]MBF0010732.1 glycoside hydrolase family 1 protein [Enterococcus casseliflavus]MBF0013477.1 glycoside hydrolase family 1 protein [Enterococcus casseliflavus]MBO1120416.1 glycoside hydrolase family 1 protein [Enterococcus casseliflavus]